MELLLSDEIIVNWCVSLGMDLMAQLLSERNHLVEIKIDNLALGDVVLLESIIMLLLIDAYACKLDEVIFIINIPIY